MFQMLQISYLDPSAFENWVPMLLKDKVAGTKWILLMFQQYAPVLTVNIE